MSNAIHGLYEFGSYRLDVNQRAFTRQGQSVPLPPKTFELLLLLVRSPGCAFSKHALITTLWPDVFVEEANLSFQISVLRKALGHDAGLIETVPKHGYRFAADVRTPPPVMPTPAHAVETTDRSVVIFAAWGKWAIAALGAFALLGVTFWMAYSRAGTEPSVPPAGAAVPLTAYPGFETMPSLSPDGSQVAFVWDGARGDNRDIYVKLVGPGEPLQLTTDPLPDMSPAWSPDGRVIAFERFLQGGKRAIFVIPALGGAERIVATLDSAGAQQRARRNLAWMWDSKRIFAGGQPSNETQTGIWLIALESGNRSRLTEPGDLDAGDTAPALSPDGRYLAFIRLRKSAQSAVYVQELSSSGSPVGLPVPATADTPTIEGLAWSPDGRSLAFSAGGHVTLTRLQRVAFTTSGQPAVPEILPFGEQARAVTISQTGRLVYSAETRDAGFWKLDLGEPGNTRVPVPVAASTYDELTPDYSPDGKRLAFASNRSGFEEIWIAEADGSNPRQMTSMSGPLCANPRWSLDGRTILFTSRREGSQDLYLLSPDSGHFRRITDDPGEEVEPRWSRDGRSIYFGSPRTGRFEIWKMDAGGGPAVRVTQHGGITASESPDGRTLYYAKGDGGIWQVPVGGGEERRVVDRLSWTQNFVVSRRGLYFLAFRETAQPAPRQPTTIDFFEFATAKRTTLLDVGKLPWVGMALSRDERSLLYSVIDSAGGNLMLVERFQ